MPDHSQFNSSVLPQILGQPSAFKQMTESQLSEDEKEAVESQLSADVPESTSGEKRSLRLDNVKGILILLVLAFHSEGISEAAFLHLPGTFGDWFGEALKAVRMPAFIFVSGYLTTPQKGLLNIVSTTGVIFVTLHCLWIAWRFVWGDFADEFSVQTVTNGVGIFSYLKVGNGIMWYLLYLIVWRALSPLFAALRWPTVVLVCLFAIGIGLQTYRDTDATSGVRFFLLTPFFIYGFQTRIRGWSFAEKADLKGWGMKACVAAFVGIQVIQYVHTCHGFGSLAGFLPKFLYGVIRIAGSILGIRLILGFTTNVWTPLARLGVTTLPIYLGHYFVLDAFWRLFGHPTIFNYYWIMPVSVVATIVLFGHPRQVGYIQRYYRYVSSLFFTDEKLEQDGART